MRGIYWWPMVPFTMMTSSNGNFCAGNSPVTGEFPAQRPVTRSFDVLFDLRLYYINAWVHNREAGDLRRHRAHYDVIVMETVSIAGSVFFMTSWQDSPIYTKWSCVHRKQACILCCVIIYPCPWCLHDAHESWYRLRLKINLIIVYQDLT